ncbi:ribosomal RNA small subunit methyltransferase A [Candidatus Saccharibacteria bacterium]|nr:ribosomal RNA small subunit methyltransferase A [Candidatus Saccharibacteria bacterium]
MESAKKSLGQHWLHDEPTLNYICDAANLKPGETVLEIGPGTGTLTKKLLERGAKTVAVEKDEALATRLQGQALQQDSALQGQSLQLEVVAGDILEFDLRRLPSSYKVVANIPYYLTSNLLRVLSESVDPPSLMVLLVQKEVAERLCAGPGQMSLLAVSIQLYYRPELGKIVPAELFTPSPKVDSQVVILHRLPATRIILVANEVDEFMKVVKAGFSQRRKKLRSSLSGGLGIGKLEADALLKEAGISGEQRAQELSLEQWHNIYKASTIQKSGSGVVQPE